MLKGQAGVIVHSESLWKKIIGKPYSGKLNERFDEGELEIGYGCDNVTLVNERTRKQQTQTTTCSHCARSLLYCFLLSFTQSSFM